MVMQGSAQTHPRIYFNHSQKKQEEAAALLVCDLMSSAFSASHFLHASPFQSLGNTAMGAVLAFTVLHI